MAGFGTGNTDKKYWDWPASYDLVESGSINSTELWTLKEKIDSENAVVKPLSGGNYKVTLEGGEMYYFATYQNEVYFVRKIKTAANWGGSEKVTFEE